jgi:uncharacterized protein (DUF433 family)
MKAPSLQISEVLWQDSARVSGEVCFRGTRIPVSILFDYLEVGQLEEFYRGYPDVTKEQVHAVIEASKELVSNQFSAK